MKKILTDAKIRREKPPTPEESRKQIGHTPLPGLLLRVTRRGAKSWSFVYRSPATGKQVRKTLGPWPTLGVDDACRLAHELKVEVLQGRDPVAEERRQGQATHTFAEVAESYMAIRARPRLASWRNVQGHIDNHLIPAWGDRPIAEITRGDVHALLDELIARGSPGAAREVKKQASAIFSWAYDRELVPTNPAYRLRRYELQPVPRERALSDDELRALWQVTGEMAYPWGTAWRLILLTGCRRSEVARSRWRDVDPKLRALVLDRERHKSRRGHVVPLSDLAWEILQDCPRFVAREAFILSTTHGRKPIACFNKAKQRLDRRMRDLFGGELAPFRTHDLRVTYRTRLSFLRVPAEWAEACLGHAQPALQRIYNQHDYLAEMAEAMQKFADHLREVVGEGAKAEREVG